MHPTDISKSSSLLGRDDISTYKLCNRVTLEIKCLKFNISLLAHGFGLSPHITAVYVVEVAIPTQQLLWF